MWESPPLSKLQESLASSSNPIGMRMRTAYFLRQAYENAIRNKDDEEEEEKGGGEEATNIYIIYIYNIYIFSAVLI